MCIDPQVASGLGNRLLRFNGECHGALFKLGRLAFHRWLTHRTHLSRVTIALVSVCPVEYSHIKRPHQGKGNVVLMPVPDHGTKDGSPLQCRERLGGLLKYYTCEAA